MYGCRQSDFARVGRLTTPLPRFDCGLWSMVCFDDDVFYLFLEKQKLAQRYIPAGYLPLVIKNCTFDDATIMFLVVP